MVIACWKYNKGNRVIEHLFICFCRKKIRTNIVTHVPPPRMMRRCWMLYDVDKEFLSGCCIWVDRGKKVLNGCCIWLAYQRCRWARITSDEAAYSTMLGYMKSLSCSLLRSLLNPVKPKLWLPWSTIFSSIFTLFSISVFKPKRCQCIYALYIT